VITCPKCSKENQDHYKFCLGCGAELPRDAAPKAFSPQTPPQGMRAVQAPGGAAAQAAPAMANAVAAGAPVAVAAGPALRPSPQPPPMQPPAAAVAVPAPAAVPAAAAAPTAGATCPQCGHMNAPTNKFCASCGYNMLLGAAQAPAGAAGAPVPSPGAFASGPPPAAAYAAAPQPAGYAAPAGGFQFTLTALRADGTEAGTFSLSGPMATVGRDLTGIFSGDSYLSPRHATFIARAGKLFVKDELSLNGVYIKLQPEAPHELRSGDVFRIGQEIIRFESLPTQSPGPDGVERLGSPSRGYIGRISLVTGRDTHGNAFPMPEHGLHIGRERGDILFPEDGYVSGLHCHLSVEGGHLYLTDLGSSNGTFARITNEKEVRTRDVLLMGQQLFRVTF
jgi:pSer/pThr/pTyr-binding forkhead associated (FHA) protein